MAALKKQKKYNWKETNLAQFGSELEKQVRHVPIKRLNLAFYGYICTCIFSALFKFHVNKLLLLRAAVLYVHVALDFFSQIKKASAEGEDAWKGAGTKEGLQVWRIVQFKVHAECSL